MIIFCCKMCGRAVKAEKKPNFCYYDRMDQIENISDDDAVKMGLFSTTEGIKVVLDRKGLIIEFIKDLQYSPITGEHLKDIEFSLFSDIVIGSVKDGQSLTEFQEGVMRKVYEK
jgi:hypothetical protein